jgi:hypothetical protein
MAKPQPLADQQANGRTKKMRTLPCAASGRSEVSASVW